MGNDTIETGVGFLAIIILLLLCVSCSYHHCSQHLNFLLCDFFFWDMCELLNPINPLLHGEKKETWLSILKLSTTFTMFWLNCINSASNCHLTDLPTKEGFTLFLCFFFQGYLMSFVNRQSNWFNPLFITIWSLGSSKNSKAHWTRWKTNKNFVWSAISAIHSIDQSNALNYLNF